MSEPINGPTADSTPEPPRGALDIGSLIANMLRQQNGGAAEQVVEVLAGVIRDLQQAARDDRGERLELRRRLDKMTELYERSRNPDGDAGFRARFEELVNENRDLRKRVAELQRMPVPAPPPLALDTPPDNPAPPKQHAPGV